MPSWFRRKEKEIPLVSASVEHGPVEPSAPVPTEAAPLPTGPEAAPTAEAAPQQPEQRPTVEPGVFPKPQRGVPPPPPSAPTAVQPKSATRKEVETVLSQGLTDVYKSMNPQEQEQFRAKGEQVASGIEQMIATFTATTRRVLQLIREWLMLIPRVNKFFLEQESKLKTDEVMKLQRRKKAEQRNKLLG